MHFGRTRGLAWLLEHGADPNATEPDLPYADTGYSALHSAAKNGASQKVIATLLNHGADPRIKSRDGKTAIDIAQAAKKTRVVKQFREVTRG